MATTFYLIRHGNNDFVGKSIVGWNPGVHLNAEGKAQANAVAAKLVGRGIGYVYSSPLERAMETAAPIATVLGLPCETREALGEVRFGKWSGKTLAELEHDPRWKLFNSNRSGTRAPGGELMLESQVRIVTEMQMLRERHPDATVALVSHADLIRAALIYYLGIPIDLFYRLEIWPASFSVVRVEDWGSSVVKLNETAY